TKTHGPIVQLSDTRQVCKYTTAGGVEVFTLYDPAVPAEKRVLNQPQNWAHDLRTRIERELGAKRTRILGEPPDAKQNADFARERPSDEKRIRALEEKVFGKQQRAAQERFGLGTAYYPTFPAVDPERWRAEFFTPHTHGDFGLNGRLEEVSP